MREVDLWPCDNPTCLIITLKLTTGLLLMSKSFPNTCRTSWMTMLLLALVTATKMGFQQGATNFQRDYIVDEEQTDGQEVQ